MGERVGRQLPKTSTFMRAKLDGVLQVLRTRRGALNAGQDVMQGTRQQVLANWREVAEVLRRQGESGLAVQVERFVERMPSVRTDTQRMAERWGEAERNRVQERTEAKLLGAPVR